MVDSITGNSAATAAASSSGSDAQALSSVTDKNQQIGKNEFLQLLVTQLKNQDPMDPMKSDQFAVNLAQFSQLEQLVSINDKIGNQSGSGDLSSLAAYLGNEVSLNQTKVTAENGTAGLMRLDLTQDASDVSVDLLNTDGSIKETVNFGALAAGKHTVDLSGLKSSMGEYGFQVHAKGVSGGTFNVNARPAGIVTGFIPGADPKLIIGSKEISPQDVVEVGVAPEGSA